MGVRPPGGSGYDLSSEIPQDGAGRCGLQAKVREERKKKKEGARRHFWDESFQIAHFSVIRFVTEMGRPTDFPAGLLQGRHS